MSVRAGSRGRSPSDSPRPGGPPIPLYLAVVWGPWNWAAVAVSQELLPEAEREETGAEGCSPGWRTEGDTPACPSSPLDQLGPLMASPSPFLLPASQREVPWGWQPAGGLSTRVGRALSLGEKPLLRRAALWARIPPQPGLALATLPATTPQRQQPLPLTTNPLPCLSFASWRCNSFCPYL